MTGSGRIPANGKGRIDSLSVEEIELGRCIASHQQTHHTEVSHVFVFHEAGCELVFTAPIHIQISSREAPGLPDQPKLLEASRIKLKHIPP
jgi:hypothetical protein